MSLFKRVIRAIIPPSLHLSTLCPQLIRKQVIHATKGQIATGPFQGMRYVTESVGSVLEPKLLGIYEKEIHPQVEALIAYQPQTVIDIGAAEGYYAVGMALRLPESQVIAFETDPVGRQLIQRLATLNGVIDRIDIRGHCDPSTLLDALTERQRPAILCDAEGAEDELLNPDLIPKLRATAMLVELHPRKAPGVTESLNQRFGSTHHIAVAKQTVRTVQDFPYTDFPMGFMPKAYLENAVSEFRQPWEDLMEWYWMVPKSQS